MSSDSRPPQLVRPPAINRVAMLAIISTVVLAGCRNPSTARRPSAPPDPSAGRAGTPTLHLVDQHGSEVATDAPLLRARPLHPVVEGLAPDRPIVLRTTEGDGESWARLVADSDGVVDLAEASPSDGTWSGADPHGWIWSLSPPPTRPLDGTTASLEVTRGDERLAALSVRRTDTPSAVDTVEVRDDGVRGDLVLPAGEGPHPGVLVLGGSEGGNRVSLRRALDLASQGFAGLAVSYFGAGDLEESIRDIPVERIASAARWLRAHPAVDSEEIGIVGNSRGGELALIAGHRVSGVGAVAAIAPSGLRWPAMRDPTAPAWTADGEPLPFVPWTGGGPTRTTDASGAVQVSTAPGFEQSLDDASDAAIREATIPVEEIPGPVLLVAGRDDGIWPACRLSRVAFRRLERSDHRKRHDDTLRCFDDVGHRIGVPGGSTMGHPTASAGEAELKKGGNPPAIARAEYETRRLLNAHLTRALVDE